MDLHSYNEGHHAARRPTHRWDHITHKIDWKYTKTTEHTEEHTQEKLVHVCRYSIVHTYKIIRLSCVRNLISAPTRVTPTSAKALDLVRTNIDQRSITDGKCDLVDFSDHALVSCSLKRNGVSNSLESTSVLTTRHWSNHGQGTDVVRMEEALARHMAALSSIGINSMWNEWKTKFIAALDDVAPRICITKKSKRRRCPWMTPELLRVLHEQKSLFKKIKKSRKPCVEWVTQHRNLRNMYSTMYRQKKNEHFQDTFNNYRKQPREFWKTIIT